MASFEPEMRMKRLVLLLPFLVLPALAQDAPHIVDTGNAEHYVWGGTNDGWHFLKRDDLSIIRERMVPGAKEERHLHRKSRQFFHVLAGTFTVEIAGTDFTLKPGQGIEVPPGTPHQAKNPTDAPAEFLVISMPPSHGDRVAAPNATPQ
jgi:mannose-6-phosphate isomerase-like protein (cupin superfamily)